MGSTPNRSYSPCLHKTLTSIIANQSHKMRLEILAAANTSYLLILTILPGYTILDKDLKEMHNFSFKVSVLEFERNVP